MVVIFCSRGIVTITSDWLTCTYNWQICSHLHSRLTKFWFRFSGHRTPPARSGHRCVADNSNLYVFGGYNPDYDESGGPENEDYPLFRELWRYHFATGCWQQIRTEGYMPTELASMSGKHCLAVSFAKKKQNSNLHVPFNVFKCMFVWLLSCSAWQQSPGVWRNWDPLWWKQWQWRARVQREIQAVVAAQLSGEEAQQNLRTGNMRSPRVVGWE